MAGTTSGAEAHARAREVAREIGSSPDDVETVAALLELGVSTDAMHRALARGRLEDAIFDAVLDPEREQRTLSPAEIEARGGLEVDEIRLLMQTAGLPPPDPDEPSFTEDEAKIFQEIRKMREVWTPELGLQVSRVAGRSLARIAHTQVQLFRLHVEPRLKAQSEDTLSSLSDVHWAFERLLPLAAPYLMALHRRLFEKELTEIAVREAEARSGGEALPGATEVAVLFCDLKDFTAFAEREGEEAAIEAIESLAQIVTEECGSDGRVVKGLGDGYMLCFTETSRAVHTGWRVIERRRDADGPGIHASLHHGVAVAHDGDYFGTVVNVAARILAAARRDELMATEVVAEATSPDFEWEHAGGSYIRGVPDTIDLYKLVGPRGSR